jgi:hypothetical protein
MLKGEILSFSRFFYLIFRRVTFQIYYSALLYLFRQKVKNFPSLKWLNLNTNSSEPIDNISCLAIVEPGVEP